MAASSPIVSGIAGRYASALFELAREAKALDQVSVALDRFTAMLDGNQARLLLQVDGQSLVQQWIRNGSVGQGIALAGDGQTASNRLQLELVRNTAANNLPLSQNVAQAIGMNRGMGPGQ